MVHNRRNWRKRGDVRRVWTPAGCYSSNFERQEARYTAAKARREKEEGEDPVRACRGTRVWRVIHSCRCEPFTQCFSSLYSFLLLPHDAFLIYTSELRQRPRTVSVQSVELAEEHAPKHTRRPTAFVPGPPASDSELEDEGRKRCSVVLK